MRSLWAIALCTLRGTIRARGVWILAALLATLVIALPLTLQGDGTPAGQARVLIGFTLGAVSAVLSLAALGSGCAAVALEIQNRQIHQLVTKPVRPLTLWLGKWLGLMLLQAAM
ncbi:MAG: hypothetical protein U1E27_02290, partial [Kiritimatiellia bacterium]|nr:hypothetical protein [Kiritimatiellia bacterium]